MRESAVPLENPPGERVRGRLVVPCDRDEDCPRLLRLRFDPEMRRDQKFIDFQRRASRPLEFCCKS